jgi:hypothetical protein
VKAIAIVPGTAGSRVVERPEPSITTHDGVKVRIIRVGICGTDREDVNPDTGLTHAEVDASRKEHGYNDFAKISLATDNVRPSKKPETWDIGGFIAVSVMLGVAMVAETLLLLWIGWAHFGLATNDNALYTFSFLMLLYFAVFSVVSARERSWFWATLPSKTFLSALAADALVGTVLTFVGLPGLKPLPGWQMLAVFVYAMVACLVLNDAVKVAMIKWRVLKAVATKPVDVTPQIAKRAYALYEQRGRQDGRAVQDWEQAEHEIRKDQPHK